MSSIRDFGTHFTDAGNKKEQNGEAEETQKKEQPEDKKVMN